MHHKGEIHQVSDKSSLRKVGINSFHQTFDITFWSYYKPLYLQNGNITFLSDDKKIFFFIKKDVIIVDDIERLLRKFLDKRKNEGKVKLTRENSHSHHRLNKEDLNKVSSLSLSIYLSLSQHFFEILSKLSLSLIVSLIKLYILNTFAEYIFKKFTHLQTTIFFLTHQFYSPVVMLDFSIYVYMCELGTNE